MIIDVCELDSHYTILIQQYLLSEYSKFNNNYLF